MSEQNFDEIEELGDDDLLEEEDGPGAEPRANRTLKLDRSEFHRAQALAAQMSPQLSPQMSPQMSPEMPPEISPVVPPAPNTSPILEPQRASHASKPHAQPASISPVAIDTNPLPTLPPPPRVPQMQAHALPPEPRKKSSALPWILGAAAVFVLVAVGGSVAGYMVVSKTHEQPTAANAPPEAKTAEVDHANSSSIDTTPATAPQKADQPAGEMPSMNVGSLPTVQPKTANAPVGAAPSPKPEPVAAPAKPAAAPPHAEPTPAPPPVAAKPETPKAAPAPAPKSQATTGVIKLPEGSKALTVIVDGGYHRVNDNGMAVVKCGHHSVRAGSSSTQEIDIPCGGMVTLQ